jgi:hypothetical protein
MTKAQEATLKELGLEERPDTVRNSKYAGYVGKRLHKPGCKSGESLFISSECGKSKIMSSGIERVNSKLKKKTDGQQVHIHVDGQNPDLDSPYSRVVMLKK